MDSHYPKSYPPNHPPTPHNTAHTTRINLVKSLTLTNLNSWNISLLLDLFPPIVVKETRKFLISSISVPASLFWSPSKSGIFLFKIAYVTSKFNRLTLPPLIFPSPGRSSKQF